MTDRMSRLRQRMIEDMNARQLSAGTQKAHIRSCKRFAAFLGRRPIRRARRISGDFSIILRTRRAFAPAMS